MKTQKYTVLVAISIFVLVVLLPQDADAQRRRGQQRQRYPIPVGATHPDFKLPNVQDGNPISLSDYRGKKVVLVHFASW